MPNIKSAKKRVRSNERRAVSNTYIKSSMKTAIKKFEKSVKEKDKVNASNNLNVAFQRVDKAVKANLVHKNKAARIKSRLSKLNNAME